MSACLITAVAPVGAKRESREQQQQQQQQNHHRHHRRLKQSIYRRAAIAALKTHAIHGKSDRIGRRMTCLCLSKK